MRKIESTKQDKVEAILMYLGNGAVCKSETFDTEYWRAAFQAVWRQGFISYSLTDTLLLTHKGQIFLENAVQRSYPEDEEDE